MLLDIESAELVTDTTSPNYGAVTVTTNNASISGYKNTMLLMQDPNTVSIPAEGTLANMDYQNPSQMQLIGFSNRIKDINYAIQAGEWTAFSNNWYESVKTSGVEIQEAQTANKENMMMGQSTNTVLKDIMSLLVDLVTYISTHTHSGVITGGDVSGVPVQTVPSDSDVVSDQTYINDNKNLAITGTYEPR